MEIFVEILRGPFFRFVITVAIVGLGAQVIISVLGLLGTVIRAGDKRVDIGGIISRSADRLNPMVHLLGPNARWFYTLCSLQFHIGVIVVPIFFVGHIRLLERGIGISWPAMKFATSDFLSIVTILVGTCLFFLRFVNPVSRKTSRLQDWFLVPLITVTFFSGYLLTHVGSSPFGFSVTLSIHLLFAEVLLLITPMCRISHCVLLPFSRFAAELCWHVMPGTGLNVKCTLSKDCKS